tara:strand:- start:5421 stop:6023 length:603 start_codon:yes stop_codon:yes gene_type:complete
MFLAEIVLMVLVIPTDHIDKVVAKEQGLGTLFLGQETQKAVSQRAQAFYDATMVDTGAYRAIYHHFIPTEAERLASRGMEKLGSNIIFPYAQSRIEAFSSLVYLAMLRFSAFLMWAPYLLIMALPAIYDGYCQWQVQRVSYGYSSPVVHRIGLLGAGSVFIILLLVMLAPISVPPIVLPAAGIVMAFMTMISLKHLSKRV